MALKDRLESRRHPGQSEAVLSESGLAVIAGTRSEPSAIRPEPDAEVAQKPARAPSNTLTAAKAAIHALLVERHAHEIDITDRHGVRARIASLAEEYLKTSGVAMTRLDYGHLIDALLDEVLGLGP